MAMFALVLMGDQIFASIGIPTPDFVKKMQESKWMYGVGVFFIGNNLRASMLQTGAFEIKIDGELVYSKLATGTMPTMHDIKSIFASYDIEL